MLDELNAILGAANIEDRRKEISDWIQTMPGKEHLFLVGMRNAFLNNPDLFEKFKALGAQGIKEYRAND